MTQSRRPDEREPIAFQWSAGVAGDLVFGSWLNPSKYDSEYSICGTAMLRQERQPRPEPQAAHAGEQPFGQQPAEGVLSTRAG
jgi:hypothetical protein